MNTENFIRRVRSAWQEISGGYYKNTATTSAGNAGGTTFICTAITAVDDFLNQKELVIAEGDALGQRRLISDWANMGNTGTLESTIGWQIATEIDIEVGEKGFWSDREILDWLNDAQDDVLNKLTDAALFKALTELVNLSISSGIATLPSDFVRPKQDYVLIDGAVAPILAQDQYNKFLNSNFLVERAYFKDKSLYYRPTNASAVELEYIEDIAEITGAATSVLDTELHPALADYAIHRGFLKSEQESLAGKHLTEYEKKILSYNQQHEGRNL